MASGGGGARGCCACLGTAVRQRARPPVPMAAGGASSCSMRQALVPWPSTPPPTPFSGGETHRAFTTTSSSTSTSDGTLREHRVQRVVPFTCEQLFDVVADVGKYKLFLPYCKDSAVLRHTPPHFMLAQLLVGFSPALGERYTSRVRLERPKAITTAALDSQIFSRLESAWRFQPGPHDPERTAHVDFTVRFQVPNPVARAAVDLVFRDVAVEQMRAFEKRCQEVYGGGS